MASEQEKADLAILKQAIDKKKIDCYEYMESLSRMDSTMSGHCGYDCSEEVLSMR